MSDRPFLVIDGLKCKATNATALIVIGPENRLLYQCPGCGYRGDVEHFVRVDAARPAHVAAA